MSWYNYLQLTKKLKKLWFGFYRQWKWSHCLWVNENLWKVVPIPNHWWKDVRIGTLREIIKQVWLKNKKDLDIL